MAKCRMKMSYLFCMRIVWKKRQKWNEFSWILNDSHLSNCVNIKVSFSEDFNYSLTVEFFSKDQFIEFSFHSITNTISFWIHDFTKNKEIFFLVVSMQTYETRACVHFEKMRKETVNEWKICELLAFRETV